MRSGQTLIAVVIALIVVALVLFVPGTRTFETFKDELRGLIHRDVGPGPIISPISSDVKQLLFDNPKSGEALTRAMETARSSIKWDDLTYEAQRRIWLEVQTKAR